MPETSCLPAWSRRADVGGGVQGGETQLYLQTSVQVNLAMGGASLGVAQAHPGA